MLFRQPCSIILCHLSLPYLWQQEGDSSRAIWRLGGGRGAAGGAALATGKVQQEEFRGFLRFRPGSEAALNPAGVGYF
jgi:hypothetical protein